MPEHRVWGVTGPSRREPSLARSMLRRVDHSRLPGSGTSRRRWRRGQPLEPPTAARPPAETPLAGHPWSLEEVGADAIELGLFPEWCLLEDPPAAGRR